MSKYNITFVYLGRCIFLLYIFRSTPTYFKCKQSYIHTCFNTTFLKSKLQSKLWSSYCCVGTYWPFSISLDAPYVAKMCGPDVERSLVWQDPMTCDKCCNSNLQILLIFETFQTLYQWMCCSFRLSFRHIFLLKRAYFHVLCFLIWLSYFFILESILCFW